MLNNIAAQIKSLLTGDYLAEDQPEEKRNPYPNGPVTFKTMTNGQVRRMQARARRRGQQDAFKHQRKAYVSRESERAVLRGMLQCLGYVDYVVDQIPDAGRVARAQKWAKEKYGSIENAVKRYEVLSGEKIDA